MTAPLRHIGFNAVFLEPDMGGAVTYAERIVPAVAAALPGARMTVFCNALGREHLAAQGWDERIELVDVGRLGRHGLRAVTELGLLGVMADRRGVDVLHSLVYTGPLVHRAASVLTVHDVIWTAPGAEVMRFTARLWRAVVPQAVRRADRVITVSEASRHAIPAVLPIEAGRIDVVHHGIDTDGAPPPTPAGELRGRLGLGDEPVVLCLAAMKDHKNLGRLVAAMAEVPDATLVLGGPTTELEATLRLRAPANVRFAGYVSAADREGLYALASAFAFPSLAEGFGLPLLEAMVRGLPVACSDIAVFREVAGDAARLFDPRDPSAIAVAVCDVLADPDPWAERGRDRAAGFTWRAAGEATVRSYERAVAA